MENEKSENNKENEYNYVKNICYNMDNGKLTINDNKNKEYKSDIYGRKIPRFLPNITGQHNRYFNDNNDNNQENRDGRKSEHGAGRNHAVFLTDACDRLAVADQERKSAYRCLRTQSHNKWRQVADRYTDAVDDADCKSRGHRHKKRDNKRKLSPAEQRCQNARESDRRADRHIKSAGDNDKHHSESQNSVDGCLLQDIRQVLR